MKLLNPYNACWEFEYISHEISFKNDNYMLNTDELKEVNGKWKKIVIRNLL